MDHLEQKMKNTASPISSKIYPSRIPNVFIGLAYALTLGLSFYFLAAYNNPSGWFVAVFLPIVVVIISVYMTTSITLDEKGVSRHYLLLGRHIREIQRIQYSDIEVVNIFRDRHGEWVKISSPVCGWKDQMKLSAQFQILIPESQGEIDNLLVQLIHRMPENKICPSVHTFLRKRGIK
jgi:hypothetical protein